MDLFFRKVRPPKSVNESSYQTLTIPHFVSFRGNSYNKGQKKGGSLRRGELFFFLHNTLLIKCTIGANS